jgi:hypothetical protein
MHLYRLQSDQLCTWSDEHAKTIDCGLAQTPSIAVAPTATARRHPAWLPHRALQTLWQARMQVCRWSRSWSQVLSFGELPGPATTDGLCATGALRADLRVPGQLPASSRAFGTDLRDQPRTVTPPRGALKSLYEHSTRCPCRPAGCRVGRCAPRQYARSVARQRLALLQRCGGSR